MRLALHKKVPKPFSRSFTSPDKESFGFIVESAEFAAPQKLQFDTLWNVARK